MAQQKESTGDSLIFGKINYLLMAGGFIIVLVGFFMMIGGATDNPEVFNADEKYSFQRLTLAPIVVMVGLLIEVFAIMMKPRG